MLLEAEEAQWVMHQHVGVKNKQLGLAGRLRGFFALGVHRSPVD